MPVSFHQEAMPPYKAHCNRIPRPTIGLALLLLISLTTTSNSCTEQEKASLLQFLAELSQDGGLASAWKEATDCCKWEGVTCSRNGTVTNISLPSRSLEGHISQSLGNLIGLQFLNLSYNSLSGGLPLELVLSRSINILDVSFNQLSGDLNEVTSSNPGQPLHVLNISSNLFTVQFTSATWNGMENLIALNASNNSITGQIPAHLCSISSSLAVLDLSHNKLIGSIPPEIGNCSRLRVLKASNNNLNGSLPNELFKATLLEYLSFHRNGLQGIIDGTHIGKLTNLVILDIGENKFSGEIPYSIGQLQRVQEIHLDYNGMSGELPSSLSNCTNLEVIDLKNNNFRGELTHLNFSKLPNLRTLDLRQNNFIGTIPESVYSCSNLTAFRLSYNKLHGQLSNGISNLKSLSFLSLTGNNFDNVTNSLLLLRNSKSLTTLLVGLNFMNETMPDDDKIDGFEGLQVLDIGGCQLSGKIPSWIAKLANLKVLFLDSNKLDGPIPTWINTLNFLFYLDISENRLTGEIPAALMNMPMLTSEKAAHVDPRIFDLPVYNDQSHQYRGTSAFPKVLNLGSNKFTGNIPPEIGQLKALTQLNISFNNLTGPIPPSISNLTNLQLLDLSSNNLTGVIPAALENLYFLSAFNISNNGLEGPIPTGGQFSTFQNSSFDGNPKLCGSSFTPRCSSTKAPQIFTKQSNKKIIFAIAFGVFFGGLAILLLVGCLIVLIRLKSIRAKSRREADGADKTTSFNSVSKNVLVMMLQVKGDKNKLTFSDILKATNNFDKEHVIGCGGYGLVYKAEQPNGCNFAIKKLDGEMCLMEREFTAEVEALSMAQHDHLVPLLGYCVYGDSRLLIYSYMENGSLDDWLHNRDDDCSIFLDWTTRLNIAKGASRGLSYIHNVCKPHIVHRDIKSSNILLDKEFKAYVADFGLSRLILPNKTHVTTELVGTLGYIPPEYGQGSVATLRGDIYSFGVVLLELLTGRRPAPGLSSSKELVPWVLEMRSQGRQSEVLDPILQGTGDEEQMLKMLELACKCVNHNPCMRPAIMEVVSCLESFDAGTKTQKSIKSGIFYI